MARDHLKRVPDYLLDQIVPEPDWSEATDALNEALQDWLTTHPPDLWIRVVVGAPYSGVSGAVAGWAMAQEWKIVEPPAPEEILTGGQGWLDRLADGPDEPLAIPHLERCYLRHHHGLKLIRQFMDGILTQRRRCLIGCSSWAWSYLSRTLRAHALFPVPLTLEALDQERLQRWLGDLAARYPGPTIVFRQADNGEYVIPPPEHASGGPKVAQKTESGESVPVISDFLSELAAHCRGIPGVAWATWRESLRSMPDTEEAEGAQESDRTPAEGQVRTLWVKPWSELSLPTLSATPGQDVLFVLHTVLLHGGLSAELITRLLPLSSFEVLQALHYLRSVGLLESAEEGWRVTALGYPAVRRFLADQGYLVDPL